ncbi:MAG TPA: S9 family peptidase [Pyrinomonadaceae bacterium]|jgi:dipeptidyl aminopeptidase/acylaminoacyl peptidase|nr:S9 family peptidase [Pyrinomonadaceae bacterium]
MFNKTRPVLFLIALAALLSAGSAFAQNKVPLTHELMWMMKRVGAPVPSPDGKWVVFSLVEPAYDEKDQVSDLWIVPTDASVKPRRLTFSKSGESGVAWSPDSRRIAFSARREGDEASQIYVLDIADGGEAVRVTSLSTGARSPQWRPDGQALLFVSTVYPGAADDDANKKIAADRKAQKYRVRVYDKFPIRNWDKWLDDTQVHLFVQIAQPGAKAKDLLAGTKLVNERGFAGRVSDSGEELDGVWTPDSNQIVFVASTNRDAAAYANTNTSLFKVSANGGEPVRLTASGDNFDRPAFRPDGKALYAGTETRTDNKTYHLDRLAKFSWPNMGQPEILTAKFDRAVGSFAFSPDSKSIYLTAEEAGNEKLYTMPADGGQVTLAMDMTRGVYTNLKIPATAWSTILIATWESAINPPEIFKLDLNSKTQIPLTSFNADQVAKIDWLPLRHFWFTSNAGKRIHNMIALPPSFDERKKYPLFVVMHGGPHSMWRDNWGLRWNYFMLSRPGYVVLLTNYSGSTGFGEAFAQSIQGDPFKGPGNEINEGADEAIRLYPFVDGSRQIAAGASYGGHMANWMQATTTRYKALISHAGLINLESQWGTSDTIYSREVNNGGPVWEQGPVWREQNPIRFAKNFRTPILLSVGENDFRVPLNQTLENWSVLQRLRIPSRLIVWPDENHWILKGENSRYWYQEVYAWFKKYLDESSGTTTTDLAVKPEN